MTDEFDYSAHATVTLTIKFEGKGHWGKGATVDEVARQGGNETLAAVSNMLRVAEQDGLHCSIVGKPLVGVTVTPRSKS